MGKGRRAQDRRAGLGLRRVCEAPRASLRPRRSPRPQDRLAFVMRPSFTLRFHAWLTAAFERARAAYAAGGMSLSTGSRITSTARCAGGTVSSLATGVLVIGALVAVPYFALSSPVARLDT